MYWKYLIIALQSIIIITNLLTYICGSSALSNKLKLSEKIIKLTYRHTSSRWKKFYVDFYLHTKMRIRKPVACHHVLNAFVCMYITKIKRKCYELGVFELIETQKKYILFTTFKTKWTAIHTIQVHIHLRWVWALNSLAC